ncbi:hypothetical protein [Demequina zhanjiangensis]|uniref:EcsC protein family protein n=1 Tax=Demequina zhanjiangensis TaxID=3051659 RepID=A0ABT8FZM3_9MICO|nr:hypothetical protein [Demequina sp. SYSU T00b26]MDN4472340.1 hypothetical protein [Demequina sp. SYSU T00b26]
MTRTGAGPATTALPPDFQERVFKAIAVQRPAVTAYIKEVRRRDPSATPAQVMKKIESQYVATTTATSAAIGASATIPAVGIPVAIGLGVTDLLFFYETTALFALCMAELRGVEIDDPERAKALVLAALLGEKRKSKITEIVMSALPASATVRGSRKAVGVAASAVSPKWGDLLSQQLPDSALVPVTMVLAKNAIAQGAVMGGVKVSSKAVPVIGAVAGGATSYYFGKSVVKSCREGFSAPMEQWPEWLELNDSDGDGVPDPSRAVVAMRAARSSARSVASKTGAVVGSAATTAGSAAISASKATGKKVSQAASSAKSAVARRPRA